MKILVSTVPFGQQDPKPLDLMANAGIDFSINPLGRKLKENELTEMIREVEVLIAGTEPITAGVLEQASRLKLVARVGIGLDSIDLHAARERGIAVSYTPDAPSFAVAELTIGLMLNLLRSVHLSNQELHQGKWQRYFGRRLGECVVGIIGAGRIGSKVIKHLSGFNCRKVMVNDLVDSMELDSGVPCEWQDKETIYREADVISIHVPLTTRTRGMISRTELEMMKPDAVLINTARGEIVNEAALFETLKNSLIAGAAVDTFEQEPYVGPLATLDRCLLTAHMGSMSRDCRARMEIEATREAVRFLMGEPLMQQVPEVEYDNQRFTSAQRESSDG